MSTHTIKHNSQLEHYVLFVDGKMLLFVCCSQRSQKGMGMLPLPSLAEPRAVPHKALPLPGGGMELMLFSTISNEL